VAFPSERLLSSQYCRCTTKLANCAPMLGCHLLRISLHNSRLHKTSRGVFRREMVNGALHSDRGRVCPIPWIHIPTFRWRFSPNCCNAGTTRRRSSISLPMLPTLRHAEYQLVTDDIDAGIYIFSSSTASGLSSPVGSCGRHIDRLVLA
jgi:hypothetical protein